MSGVKPGVIRTVVIVVLLIVNIGCDQVSKAVVRKKIYAHQELKFMNDHLTLTNVENAGSFLSLGGSLSMPVRFILLTLIPLLGLLIGVIIVLLKTRLNSIALLGSCFLLGGGIGNVYDRLMHGSVTDFIHLKFGIFQTGIFNFADVSIMTGVIILIFRSYLQKRPPRPMEHDLGDVVS